MSARDNGSPAFPSHGSMGEIVEHGMTLHDYFAAHAPEVPDMQTFPIKQWHDEEVVEIGGGMRGIRQVLHQETWTERSARWASEYADAMMKERAK